MKTSRVPVVSNARSEVSISTDSPNARACARCGCSARLAVTTCEPAGMPPITTPSTSWQAGFCSSCRSSIMRTNRVRLARNAAARSGAARPSAEPPCPRMVSANWSAGGMILANAEASRTSSAIGSSSNRSSETQATSRVSVLAHWASRVDFPYPAGAVTVDDPASARARTVDEVGATHRAPTRESWSGELRIEQLMIQLELGRDQRRGIVSHARTLFPRGRRAQWRADPTRPACPGEDAPTAGPTRPEQCRRCPGDPRSVRDRGRPSAASRR